MIDYRVDTRGIRRKRAYRPNSVAVDLKLSPVVGLPQLIVNAVLPLDTFAGRPGAMAVGLREHGHLSPLQQDGRRRPDARDRFTRGGAHACGGRRAAGQHEPAGVSHTGTHADDSWAGPTLNVAMPSRVPGRSSAGSAAAVAASMAVLGLAEETGGSIQNPASAQVLVGIKPTIGLVPNAGVVPLSGNRDVVRPIARCVRHAALCLDVLAGYTAEDPCRGRQEAFARLHRQAPQKRAERRAIGLYGAGWRTQPLSAETQAL